LKHKPKKQRSHDPRPRGRLKKGILHLLRLAGFALILCTLLTLIHLLIIGIPAPLTRKIAQHLQKNGMPVQVDSITLSPHRGWVLHDARIFSTSPDDLKPLLQTDKLYVNIWPKGWKAISRGEWTLRIRCEQADVSLGLPWESALEAAHPFRTVSGLNARLHIRPSGLTIESAQMNWGGCRLQAAGQADFPEEKKPLDSGLFSKFQTRAIQIVDLLADQTFSTAPEVILQFNIPSATPESIEVTAAVIANGFRWKGTVYDSIIGAGHLRGSELQLESLRIARRDHGQLEIAGSYNLESGITQLEVDNSLPLEDLLSLLPQRAVAAIALPEVELSGTADFSAVCGPCPPAQLPEQIRLQVHNLPLTFRDITFDPLAAELIRNGSRIEIKQAETRANGHLLAGNGAFNLDSQAWNFAARGRIPTAPIGELLGGDAQEWIDRIEFTNRLADITVEASRGGGDGTFQMRSSVSGRDVLCAGVPLDTLDLTMSYSNRTFYLTPIEATRGDRAFSGTIQIDLDRKLAMFDAESSLPPDEIAQIIEPDHPTVLTNFTFNGPLTARASGQIDYSGGTAHAAQGSIRAETVSARGFTADSVQCRIEARGDQLIFSEMVIGIFDGVAEGSAVFDLDFNDSEAPYRLDMDANEMDLAALLRHFGAERTDSITGRLFITLDVSADATEGFWASASGRGAAEIENGKLRDLPVLGGFARLIRTTLPGFSLFSLTSFYSEYEFRDKALRSENLQFGGTLFSARARGKYSPQGGLNFIVRAEPLRQTREDKKWYQFHLWGADALKQGTSPLFDLLEFRLTGSLDKPNWRMLAIPKEAYELLEKLTPSSSAQ